MYQQSPCHDVTATGFALSEHEAHMASLQQTADIRYLGSCPVGVRSLLNYDRSERQLASSY